MNVAILPGDGIGPEIIAQALRVLKKLELGIAFEQAPVGGAAYAASGDPLPEKTLAPASTLRPEVVAGLDILIVRELTGDIYFGQPKGIRQKGSEREGFDTMLYSESEIRRIARVGFDAARKRSKKLCSVDKANVLETSQLWREVLSKESVSFPD